MMTNPDTNSLPAEETPTPYAENDVRRFAARRAEMGLTLAEVYAKTRISVKNLAALEGGDFSALPPPVYAKAFIRQYADFLEIDARPLLANYDVYLKSQEDPRQVRKNEESEKPPQGIKLGKFFGLLLGVLFVGAALWLFLYNPNAEQPDHPDPQSVTPVTQTETPIPPEGVAAPAIEPPPAPLSETVPLVPAAPQPQPVTPPISAKPLPPPVPATNAPVSVSSGSQKLILKAKETTWVGILIDNQEGQQVLLQPGDVVTYTGNQFRMDIGNAGGVDVILQGKTIAPLGKSGQVIHVTLP